jgi:alkylated DNA repair dioxygenase AlkB
VTRDADTLPPGFELARGAIDAPPLEELVAAIAWEQRSITMYGREMLQPRLTAWMGSAAYVYSGVRHEPAPVPACVREIEAQIGHGFNSVLANLYRNGRDSVAWHADDELELGPQPTIASVSIGAPRRFGIKTRDNGHAWYVTLRHGDLLVMHGRSQADYLHCLPKTAQPVGMRVNLTFRTVV